MSRAYRVSVEEQVSQIIRAEDHVSSRLEILAILPTDQMGELLAAELIKQGFERKGQSVVRKDGNISVTVDLTSGHVTVRAEQEQSLSLSGTREGFVEGIAGQRAAEEKLRKELQKELQGSAESERRKLQEKVTAQLEGKLRDLRAELDQAVNRATAEALKRRAAELGQIKSITEDTASGSLTIVVEV